MSITLNSVLVSSAVLGLLKSFGQTHRTFQQALHGDVKLPEKLNEFTKVFV